MLLFVFCFTLRLCLYIFDVFTVYDILLICSLFIIYIYYVYILFLTYMYIYYFYICYMYIYYFFFFSQAAFAIALPDTTVCIFSTGRRASSKLLALVKSLVDDAGYLQYVTKSNAEQLDVCVNGRSSSIFSYPAAVSTLRGSGGGKKVF